MSPSIGRLGEPGFGAATTNLNINFLAKPEARDMVATVRLLRLGRRLAVGEVQMFSDAASQLVAHAVASYALPFRNPRQRDTRCCGNMLPSS
jgi:acyl-coenzyme A thioesterase PaaI-like protein